MQENETYQNRESNTALVLLPGLDGTGLLFSPLIEVIEQYFPVRTITYPYHQPLGYAALENLVRQQLPVDAPFVILGESFSGPIATAIAASPPPGLKGLILSCSFIRNPLPALAALKPFVNLLPISSAPMVLLDKALLGQFSTPNLRAMINRTLRQLGPDTVRARIQAVLEVDARDKMAAVTIPTLYLRATHDHVIPKTASTLIARLQPGIHITDFDAPHMLLQTCSREAAAAITTFINSLDTEEITL